MTDIVLVFEVHQPYRLKQNFFWGNRLFRRLKKGELLSNYLDDKVNQDVFNRACKKCYFPSNQILLDLIDKYKIGNKQVKVSFSLSGVFLEQCEAFNRDLLESFKQLAKTGCVEFLSQTYYHSLASLYPEKNEFIEQVKMHQQVMEDLLICSPRIFENTELLYNNAVAKTIEKLGYNGIYTEGAERILHGRSPNQLYKPKNCEKIKVLLRNYKLTDDVGFRFSTRSWSEWPLTAPKYAGWLSATQGDCINIFPDYETFGEHHWPESGIHDFLRYLPIEILKYSHLRMATPSEVAFKYASVGDLDVPELGGTISWADVNRDASGWLGNTMQWAYYSTVRRLEPFVKETGDPEFLRVWRHFQTSDHLYYMFTGSGGPSEVHSYFSPFRSAVDAFITSQSALFDFENRIRLASIVANEPFLFYTGKEKSDYTGIMVWSLEGFTNTLLRVDTKSLEFHDQNGDFEKWVETSLGDKKLAEILKEIRSLKLKGENLKKTLIKVTKERFQELNEQIREAIGFF